MDQLNKNERKRLVSLDTLRGFDMFWIIGGENIFIPLGALTGWPVFEWWSHQLHHTSWHGFYFYDMIFPLFLFIAGTSFPFSVRNRYSNLPTRKPLYKHIFTRGIVLVLLGILYNNGLDLHLDHLRYGSVLGRIGLGWMLGALIFINSRKSFRIIWFVGILILYWLLLQFFPATDLGATDPFSMEGSLVGYVDRLLMPGVLYCQIHDPEGILSTLPAISTALLGMFAGEFVLSESFKDKQLLKPALIALFGVLLIAVSLLWNEIFPINKNLWTSSFVCLSGGLSLLLFALFYLVIDVLGFKSWTPFFVVIGVNSITIYLVQRFVDFKSTTNLLFGGLISMFPENWQSLVGAIGYTALSWIFLYMLHKKKIYLKV